MTSHHVTRQPAAPRTEARHRGRHRLDARPTTPVVHDAADFAAFAEASATRLRDTAFLLCRDWHLAQDLSQTTLIKMYLSWNRISHMENPNAYARKVMLRVFLDHRRLKSSGDVITATVPDRIEQQRPELRITLVEALAVLSPLDRAIVVLRYWEDYSIERVADVLGITVSLVKNRTMRSLARLRNVLGDNRLELFQ